MAGLLEGPFVDSRCKESTTAIVLVNATGETIATSRRVVGDLEEAIQRVNAISARENVTIQEADRAAQYASVFLVAHLPELQGGWLPSERIARILSELNTARARFLDSDEYSDLDANDTYAEERDWQTACDIFDQASRPIAAVTSWTDDEYEAVAYRSDCSQVERFEITVTRDGKIRRLNVVVDDESSTADSLTRP